ncbi:MAG: hypothetical protein DWP97_05425 [Calditrichaeota bacterium]|nr:MAG: hypothetical protein DWP97_05425 [Calditrichota bacterium]
MKKLIIALCILTFIGCGKKEESKTDTTPDNTPAHLTETQTYYFGMILSGSERSQSNEEAAEIQKAHLANIGRLADEGLMALAGPFWNEDNSNKIRGLFIYEVDSIEQAQELVDTDPAVQKNRLAVDVYPWIGSKNMTYTEPVEMRGYQAAIFWNNSNDIPLFNDIYTYFHKQLALLSDSASIVLAGPFDSEGMNIEGKTPHSIFIFSVDTTATISDFASKSKWLSDSLLTVDVLNFYGPVGLKE